MDAVGALLIAAVPTAVASFAVGAVSRAQKARDSMGERVGKLESWRDFERGRRAGLREARRRAPRGDGR